MTDELINIEQIDTQKYRPPQPAEDERSRELSPMMRRVYLLGLILPVLILLNNIVLYRTYRPWQILVDILSLFVALILIVLSYRRHLYGRDRAAQIMLLIAIGFLFVPGEFFLQGSLPYQLVSCISILVILGLILELENIRFWLTGSVLIVLLLLLTSQFQGIPRFDTTQAIFWQIVNITLSALFLAGMLWQLIKIFRQSSIRFRLIATFTVIGLIPSLIIVTISSIQNFQSARQDVTSRLNAISSSRKSALQLQLSQQQVNLGNVLNQEAVSQLSTFSTISEEDLLDPLIETARNELLYNLRNMINEALNEFNSFESISIVNLEGEVLVSTSPILTASDMSEEPAFVSGLSQTSISPYKYDPVSLANIYVSEPIIYSGDTMLGVLIAQIKPSLVFESLSVNVDLIGTTGEIYFVNPQGILLSPVRNPNFVPGDVTISPAIQAAISSKYNGSGLYPNYGGELVVGSFTWVPDLEVGLIVEQSQEEAFRAMRTNQIVSVIITIVTIMAAIGIGLITSRSITEPITELVNTASLVADGDLSQTFSTIREDEIGILGSALNDMTRQLRQSLVNLEGQVQARTVDLTQRASYLETIAEIGRTVTEIYNLENLLTSVTHLISEKFDFYHVGIFMLDEEGEYAVLRAANSEGGWRMLSRQHKLKVGEQGIVGYVTGTRKPLVRQRVGDDDIYFDNPDLPQTQSEMALPLMAGGQILGALDVQSTKEYAFADEDVEVLQVLADNVAMAIRNTQLFEQLEERLETERRAYSEYSRAAWQQILESGEGLVGFRSDARTTRLIQEVDTDEYTQMAMQNQRTIYSDSSPDGEHYPLAMPIKVRGEITAAILETKKKVADGPWTTEEVEALEAIGEQIAIALENARLYEESQRMAQRERIAAEVAGKVWSSSDINTILQTAVQELSRALNVSQGVIQLKVPSHGRDMETKTLKMGESIE